MIPDAKALPSRFRIRHSIAVGGHSAVFAGDDRLQSRSVAVKLPRSTESGDVRLLRNEIRILRHVAHPHLVEFVDGDEAAKMPWYAMRLYPITLRQFWHLGPITAKTAGTDQTIEHSPVVDQSHIEPSPPSPPALRTALGHLADVCDALSYLHGRGLVHGDLKPENIFIEAGHVVIGDLGAVAYTTGRNHRDVLDDRLARSLTRQYAAPEWRSGRTADGRADLYSVGCILLELLTGRPPGPLAAELGALEPGQRPQLLATRMPAAGRDLIELCARLVEPIPRRRASYAADVRDRLASHAGRDPAASPRGSVPYLFRSPLVGRDQACADLLARLRQRDGTEPCILGITGASGIGKTRVQRTLLARAGHHGPVLALSPDPAGRAGGIGALTDLVDALLPALRSTFDQDTLAHRFPDELRRLALPAGDRSAALERFRARIGAIVQLLTYLVDEGDHTLFIDDLELWDAASLQVLRGVAGTTTRTGTWLVCSGRGLGIETLAARLQVPADRVHVHTLPGIEAPAIVELIGHLLGTEAPPPALVEHILRHGGSNPLLVAELLRAAVEGGRIVRRGGAWTFPTNPDIASSPTVEVPDVEHLVGARLAQLAAPDRALVELAAIAGPRGHWSDLVAMAADSRLETEPDAGGYGRRLVAAGLLHDVGPRWHFESRAVRDAVVAALEPTDRQDLHAHIAAFLGRRSPTLADQRRHAHHLAQAGALEDAARVAVNGARDAWERADLGACAEFLDVVGFAEQQLGSSVGDDDERYVWEADARFSRGDTDAVAIACVQGLRALGQPVRLTRRARIVGLVVDVLRLAIRHGLRLRPWRRVDPTRAGIALRLRSRLMTVHFERDDMLAMLGDAAAAAALADRAPSSGEGVQAYAMLGATLIAMGAMRPGERLLALARTRCRPDNVRGAVDLAVIEASSIMNICRWDRAHQALDRAETLATEHTLVEAGCDVARTRSLLAWLQGHPADAVEHATVALERATQLGLTWQARWARLALGAARLRQGLPQVAAEHVDHLRDDLATHAHGILKASALAIRIGASSRMGNHAHALATLAELDAMVRERPALTFANFYAHVYVPEAIYSAWQAGVEDAGASARRMRRATAGARRHARASTVARPLALLHQARLAALEGSIVQAHDHIGRAEDVARDAGLGFDGAVARTLRPTDGKTEHAIRARFGALGCLAPPFEHPLTADRLAP